MNGVPNMAKPKKKLTLQQDDITFFDPVTMKARCTFNQCIDKFTIEDFEVQNFPSGKLHVTAFHKCNECGQRVKAKGDGTRAYKKWTELMNQQDPSTLDECTRGALYLANSVLNK